MIWESLAIGEYLAERYPAVWPVDVHERALARSAASEMHAGFAALREELPFNCRSRRAGVVPSLAAQAEIERWWLSGATCRQAIGDDEEAPGCSGVSPVPMPCSAPVALRFHTYGVALPELAARCVDTVRQDIHVQAWIDAACAETAIIPRKNAANRWIEKVALHGEPADQADLPVGRGVRLAGWSGRRPRSVRFPVATRRPVVRPAGSFFEGVSRRFQRQVADLPIFNQRSISREESFHHGLMLMAAQGNDAIRPVEIGGSTDRG